MPPLQPQAPTATTSRGGGRGVVGLAQRQLHVARDRAGDQQHVGVARRGDEVNAEALDVIDRAVQADDLHLAAVAGTGIHLADVQRAAAGLWRCGPSTRRRGLPADAACGLSSREADGPAASGARRPGPSSYLAVVTRASLRRAASSQTFVMRMAGSASAHRPQKVHLPRSSVTDRVPSLSLAGERAGRTSRDGRAARPSKLAKSISGRPRAWLDTSAGVCG